MSEKTTRLESYHIIGIDPGNHFGIFAGQLWLNRKGEKITLGDIQNINVFFWFSCTHRTFQDTMDKFMKGFVELLNEINSKRKSPATWLIYIEDQFMSFKKSSLRLSWNAGYAYGYLEALLNLNEVSYRGPYRVHPSYWYNLFSRPEPERYYQPEFMELFNLRFNKLVKVGYSYPRKSQHAFEAFLIAIAGLIRMLDNGSGRRKKRG